MKKKKIGVRKKVEKKGGKEGGKRRGGKKGGKEGGERRGEKKRGFFFFFGLPRCSNQNKNRRRARKKGRDIHVAGKSWVFSHKFFHFIHHFLFLEL